MTRRMIPGMMIVGLALCLGAGWTWAQAPSHAEALQKITTYKFGDSREPLSVVEDLVKAAAASPQDTKVLATELAALLNSDATLDAKQFVCRQLSLIGGADNVPALAALLPVPDTSDMARYALERLTGAEASEALLKALASAPDSVKPGIVNSLGVRRYAPAVEALAALTVHADKTLAGCAISALGKIGGAGAAKALADAKDKAAAELQVAVADARVQCSYTLLKAGKAEAAADAFQALSQDAKTPPQRVAAFKGLVAAKGAAGIPLVTAALVEPDTALRASAVSLVRELAGADATQAFVGQLDKMAPEGQVMLLAALASRGDRAAGPAAVKAVASDNLDIRIAALDALAKLGDASAVMLLAQTAAKAETAELKAARKSLDTINAEGANAEILKGMKEGDAAVRVELIKASAERGIADAAPVLLVLANEADPIRGEALEALTTVGRAEDVPALVALMVGAADDTGRGKAAAAVVATARKISDPAQRCALILAALPGAPNVAGKCALLKALGELGDDAGLEAVRAAVKDADASVRDTAIRALAKWPTQSVLDDLLAAVKQPENDTLHSLALMGYMRLLAMPGDRPMDDTVQRVIDAMALATADEKKVVLGNASNIADPRILKFVEPYLEDASLQAEATAAALKIAKAICGAYRDDAQAVVTKILAQTSDDNVKKQANEVQAQINKFGPYVVSWEYAGPYMQEGKDGAALFDVAFAPEGGDAAGVAWKVYPVGSNPNKPWLLEFDEVMDGANRAVYLRTNLVAAADMDAMLQIGSDDGVKVWLNGAVVHANNASRACQPGEDKVAVKLVAGANPLLLKVTQTGSNWEACLSVTKPDGSAIEGVQASIVAPH